MAGEVVVVENELEDALSGKIGDEEVVEEGGEEKGEDTSVENKGEDGEEGASDEPSEIDKLKGELESLRQIALEQKRENAKLSSRLNRLSRPKTVKQDKEDFDEDEDVETTPAKGKKQEVSTDETEVLEKEVQELHKSRDPLIDMQLDVLSETKKFGDILDVCSQGNINDITDALAKHIVEKEGVDYHRASLEVDKFIWGQKNPYKYLYGLIKEYHPKYLGAPKGQDKSTEGEKGKGKEKENKAPKTIANVPGSDGGSGGWTAAKIDAMPETELHKVPPDVYQKWLTNELE